MVFGLSVPEINTQVRSCLTVRFNRIRSHCHRVSAIAALCANSSGYYNGWPRIIKQDHLLRSCYSSTQITPLQRTQSERWKLRSTPKYSLQRFRAVLPPSVGYHLPILSDGLIECMEEQHHHRPERQQKCVPTSSVPHPHTST